MKRTVCSMPPWEFFFLKMCEMKDMLTKRNEERHAVLLFFLEIGRQTNIFEILGRGEEDGWFDA